MTNILTWTDTRCTRVVKGFAERSDFDIIADVVVSMELKSMAPLSVMWNMQQIFETKCERRSNISWTKSIWRIKIKKEGKNAKKLGGGNGLSLYRNKWRAQKIKKILKGKKNYLKKSYVSLFLTRERAIERGKNSLLQEKKKEEKNDGRIKEKKTIFFRDTEDKRKQNK